MIVGVLEHLRVKPPLSVVELVVELAPKIFSGHSSDWKECKPLVGWWFLCPCSPLVPVTLNVGADVVVSSPMILGLLQNR